MREIILIARREFLARIKNKTFLFMTVLSPLLIVGFFVLSVYMTQMESTQHRILVIDESRLFMDRIPNKASLVEFEYSNEVLLDAEQKFSERGYTALLWISPNVIEGGAGACKLFYSKIPGFALQNHIRTALEKIVYEEKLLANDIQPEVVRNARQHIQLILQQVGQKGSYADADGMRYLGFLMAALMMVFILMYGMMVFRSVLEEKQSRIVEVILTSVRPVKLLIGKISGIALLGLLQFICMGLLTWLLSMGLRQTYLSQSIKLYEVYKSQQATVFKNGAESDFSKLSRFDENLELFDLFKKAETLAFDHVFWVFVAFFLAGFLFYSAFMAAMASAADTEADAQQFLLPVHLPLLAAYFIAVQGMLNPDAAIVQWASWIPFTSPVVMISRITSGIPLLTTVFSWLVLCISFGIMIVWSARIYQNGVLNSGKKTRWLDLWRWTKKHH